MASALTADYRVRFPDRPGYGRSAGGSLSMAATADRLADTLRTHDSGPAIVVGHSYGGGVAVLLAGRHPRSSRGWCLSPWSVEQAVGTHGADRCSLATHR